MLKFEAHTNKDPRLDTNHEVGHLQVGLHYSLALVLLQAYITLCGGHSALYLFNVLDIRWLFFDQYKAYRWRGPIVFVINATAQKDD